MTYRSAPVPTDTFNLWTRLAEQQGYGKRGRIQFLDVLLEIAESLPSLTRKR